MATQDMLNKSLFDLESASSSELQISVLQHFWGSVIKTSGIGSFNAFFKFYQEQCSYEDPNNHVAQTHQDIVDIIRAIETHPDASMSNLMLAIQIERPEWNDEMRLARSIALATRLFLMIHVQSELPEHTRKSQVIPWAPTSSLVNVVRGHFVPATQGPQPIKRFSNDLNAYSLEKIGGFSIRWTDELSRHLRLDDNSIYLYHHVSVLRQMRGCDAITNKILPKDLLDETLDSVSLLLPRSNPQCTLWLRKQQLDPGLNDLRPAPKRVMDFNYWREDLVTIAEAFDRHEPSTLSQWVFDRRKRVQWWTFWVAFVLFVLTVVFGLIQSATGIAQAWASIQSLHGSSSVS